MRETPLHKDILATLAYFDVFDYPLTAHEIWRYHIDTSRLSGESEADAAVTLFDVCRTLREIEARGSIAFSEGFYFFPDRRSLVSQRLRRSTDSLVKLGKVKRVVRLISILPFIRMVAVTGRLAVRNADKGSDWDVLIALRKGRIWIGRTFVTVFLHLIGKRRWGRKTRDRVCLNYFITDRSLEIQVKDLFAAKEYAFALPIFGTRVFEDFARENGWIRKFLPLWNADQSDNYFILKESPARLRLQKVLEAIFDSRWLEKTLRTWQLRKIERNPKTHHPESYIVASDEALVFLPSPQGPKVFEKFKERLKRAV